MNTRNQPRKRYSKAQKEEIFKRRVCENPCDTCNTAVRIGCISPCAERIVFESQFQAAKQLGVLGEAKLFFAAAIKKLKLNEQTRHVNDLIKEASRELNEAGLPKDEIEAAFKKM